MDGNIFTTKIVNFIIPGCSFISSKDYKTSGESEGMFEEAISSKNATNSSKSCENKKLVEVKIVPAFQELADDEDDEIKIDTLLLIS